VERTALITLDACCGGLSEFFSRVSSTSDRVMA
jgi:hypothetical protein